jgi:hypothetical protein
MRGTPCKKIMGNKPQVCSAIIIQSSARNDLLHQGQTADVSINRAKTGTFSIETPGTLMGGLVWFDKIFQACQGPTSFIAYERGLMIFEYSHVFRSLVVLSCEIGLASENSFSFTSYIVSNIMIPIMLSLMLFRKHACQFEKRTHLPRESWSRLFYSFLQ